VKQLELEKQELIDCIGSARMAEQEYNQYLDVIHPDQLVVNELLQQQEEEIIQLQELERQVQVYSNLLKKKQEKVVELTEKNLADEGIMKDVIVRETNCIHLSKTKDPQMEQLGTWYKTCISLLHSLHDISKCYIHSDSKIEIVYNTTPEIKAVYSLIPNPIDGIFVHVHVI
jgi:hypothetical protein